MEFRPGAIPISGGDVIDTEDVTGKAVAKAAGTVILAKLTRGKIHGNARASPKPQIRYVIRDGNGDAVKTGISGKPLNQDGTSGRANTQVNALNRAEGTDSFTAEVAETGIPGRADRKSTRLNSSH